MIDEYVSPDNLPDDYTVDEETGLPVKITDTVSSGSKSYDDSYSDIYGVTAGPLGSSESLHPLMGTIYEAEYVQAVETFKDTVSSLASIYRIGGKKYKLAYLEAEQQLNATVAKLMTSLREHDQGSISSQVAQVKAAGLNPQLYNYDASSAAGAGAGVVSPTPLGDLPEPITGLDILSAIGDVVSIGADLGLGIAGAVMNYGKMASDIAHNSSQIDLMNLSKSSYVQSMVEKFVYDQAPQFDESIQAFPSWSPASIPTLPKEFQSDAIEYAKSFYGSDRHRAGQLANKTDVELQRDALAHLYGSGFYSDSLGVMSENVAKYSGLLLDSLESRYKMEKSYNDLYDKYYSILSPEVMAEVQNKVNQYQSDLYGNLDGSAAAGLVNTKNLSETEYLDAFDETLAAGATNSANKYNSVLYDKLDAEKKAAYENYYTDLQQLQLNFVQTELDAEAVLFDEVRKDLKSPDPSVRLAAAKQAQRIRAKSDARSSRTGWSRFSDGASQVGQFLLGAGGVALGAAKAFGTKAVSAPVLPATMPSVDSRSDYYL